MEIPTELTHKPFIMSEDYDRIDGRKANHSDAKGLSLGLAQWNQRGKVDISAKVWRHTVGKWSRQSEELPLHRVLGLAILIVRSKKVFLQRYHTNEKDYPPFLTLDQIGREGDDMTVSVCEENEFIEDDLELFEATLARDEEILSERMHVLGTLLRDLHN